MTLIFTEGFEVYSETADANISSIATKVWTGGHTNNTNGLNLKAGRIAGYCVQMPGLDSAGEQIAILKGPSFGNIASGYVGFGYKTGANPAINTWILGLVDVATMQIGVYVDTDGRFSVRHSSGTVLGSGSILLANTWYYMELFFVINNSVGQLTMRLDGAAVTGITAVTGLDTTTTANASIDRIWLMGGKLANFPSYDDIYVCSTAGTVNNFFLGNFRTRLMRPDAAGANTEWVPNTGANYAAVAEAGSDDDATYVRSVTDGAIDLYNHTSPAHGGTTIVGLNTHISARKETLNNTIIPAYKTSAGTIRLGADISLTADTYSVYTVIAQTNPETSALWTQGEIDGLQIGVKKKAV